MIELLFPPVHYLEKKQKRAYREISIRNRSNLDNYSTELSPKPNLKKEILWNDEKEEKKLKIMKKFAGVLCKFSNGNKKNPRRLVSYDEQINQNHALNISRIKPNRPLQKIKGKNCLNIYNENRKINLQSFKNEMLKTQAPIIQQKIKQAPLRKQIFSKYGKGKIEEKLF